MKRFHDMVFYALMVGILVQVLMMPGEPGGRGSAQSPAQLPFRPGDTLRSFSGVDEAGLPAAIQLATETGLATVLYAFHPDCSFSRESAPGWARHFTAIAAADSRVRQIAVTAADPASAHAFAQRFQWQIDIRSIVGVSAREKQHSLVSRTPWVFVFDSQGVLRMEGHGNRVAEAEETVSLLLSQQPVTNRRKGSRKR